MAKKVIYYNDKVVSVQIYDNDHLGNINGPALITYSNFTMAVSFYINDICHRELLPAKYSYDDEGLYFIKYVNNGKVHRINGPAIIEFIEGRISSEEFVINDFYEEDRISYIMYSHDLNKKIEYFNKNSNILDPMCVEYFCNEVVKRYYEGYFIVNKNIVYNDSVQFVQTIKNNKKTYYYLNKFAKTKFKTLKALLKYIKLVNIL